MTVAASMFPPAVRQARADPADGRAAAVVRGLHRTCRVYAVVGVVVPVFGLGVALQMDVVGDAWLIVSMVLTAIAAAVLGLAVLPRQSALLADVGTPDGGTTAATTAAPDPLSPFHRATVRLGMLTGVFNLLWATVTVLMIARPGSSTGA
ncbi:hypothetical protein EHYA_01277 [Embleya hyalina]|uniref:Uncharacterized protein n=1 Tax=Embleya hyalina TaxID=516124 RepID=A0A401YGA3_9ACTN|nr:hypothetical protein EHYA_01277 [Embleya hyalina]